MKNQKSKRDTNNKKRVTNKVWRIFHFEQRFELPDNIRKCRKSALEFTRDFVGDSGGDEAVGYQRQFALLTNGNGQEFAQIYGLYRLLVNMSAKQSKAYRGYLLDARNQPLTNTQIAKLLNISTEKMKRFLKRFESVDLLEYVDLPEFDLSRNEVSDTEKSGSGRKRAENSARRRKPLKNGKRCNDGNKVNAQKATNGLMAVDKDKYKNGKAHKHKSNAQNKGKSKGQSKAEPPSTPATTPPFEPQESDASGGSKVIPFTAPRGSAYEQVGTRIYVALGYKWDISSPKARREICSFASKIAQAHARLAGLPPPVFDELCRRAVDEARKIGRRGRRNEKPGAVVNKAIDNLVAARLREAM